MIKEELTQERLKELLYYNSETGDFTWRVSKSARAKIGTIAGSFDAKGYRQIRTDGKLNLAHRLAWLYSYGAFPIGERSFIDHIDGNPANNRLNNLRVCSQTENQRNRGSNSNNKTGFKGVSWHKAAKSFCAQIVHPMTKKKECYYGYATPEEASVVYQAKSVEYYDEFHRDEIKNDSKILPSDTGCT